MPSGASECSLKIQDPAHVLYIKNQKYFNIILVSLLRAFKKPNYWPNISINGPLDMIIHKKLVYQKLTNIKFIIPIVHLNPPMVNTPLCTPIRHLIFHRNVLHNLLTSFNPNNVK